MNPLRPFRPLYLAHRHFQTVKRRDFTSSIIPKSSTFIFTSTTSNNMATTEPVLLEKVPTNASTPSEPTLPKITPHEFRIYNRMAEHMDYFHNHFRETWNVLYSACETGKRSKGMSIRQFVAMGQQFCSQLEMHHGIEERYVFFNTRPQTQLVYVNLESRH